MDKPFVRSPFNYDRRKVSFFSGLDCSNDPTRAQQNMRDETDINFMIAKYGIGVVSQLPVVVPNPVDFDEVFDFQSAMNVVVKANETFASLPSKLRTRFQNDPRLFVEFFNDPSNEAEARSLGLLATPVASPVVQAPVGSSEPVSKPD